MKREKLEKRGKTVCSLLLLFAACCLLFASCENPIVTALLPEILPEILPEQQDNGIHSSVDDYSHLEPAMAPNPSRAEVRVGGTTVIGIPDYLLNESGGTTAIFSVNPNDTAIVKITSQNERTCTIQGLTLGSAKITVTAGTRTATIIIAILPSQQLYTLPATEVKKLGSSTAWSADSTPDTLPGNYANYTYEPTCQIAWNWCAYGIDFLAYYVDPANKDKRGWVRTTYNFGGWRYDLNGINNGMTNGVQTNGNVKLELKPEFVYDNGIPYLQINHTLTNNGTSRLSGQKFGASADIMLFNQDRAGLTYLEYGALMTNGSSSNPPTLKFRLVCQNVQGINNVSTLWLGTYGNERSYVYTDKRVNIPNNTQDTAMNFSYQNIDLNPGESKIFVIRFTQVQ